MTEQLHRASPADLEIRGSDGRTVVGIAVPFDQPAEIRSAAGGFVETFRPGAFARTIAERGAERVKFLAQHDHGAMPLGRATLLREDPAGLYGEFRVSKTSAGDEALELIKDGALDALSVGFRPVRDQWSENRRQVDRLEVALHEVSAVTFPSYAGAAIAAVRAQLDPLDPDYVPPIPAADARRALAGWGRTPLASPAQRLARLRQPHF